MRETGTRERERLVSSEKEIKKLLHQALLQDGEMVYALYEYELEEHIDYWYDGLQRDRNEFVFAVTEHSGDTAMVCITKEKKLYVNEEGREWIKGLWGEVYRRNMELLIPVMANELANDIIAVNGVSIAGNQAGK